MNPDFECLWKFRTVPVDLKKPPGELVGQYALTFLVSATAASGSATTIASTTSKHAIRFILTSWVSTCLGTLSPQVPFVSSSMAIGTRSLHAVVTFTARRCKEVTASRPLGVEPRQRAVRWLSQRLKMTSKWPCIISTQPTIRPPNAPESVDHPQHGISFKYGLQVMFVNCRVP